MASTGSAHMQPVDVTEFCRRASQLFIERTFEEQMISALGGISNLYVHKSIENGEESFIVDTKEVFVSKLVSKPAILAQIQGCSGVPALFSNVVLDCLRDSLRECFPNANTRVILPCLGVFEPVNLEQNLYSLEFRNPIHTHF